MKVLLIKQGGMILIYKTVKPFIKWAGGKSQLLEEIRKKYPKHIKKYCEPFVGGGAVLLDILVNFHAQEVLINDINPELTNTYTQIKDNVEAVILLLSEMQEKYWSMAESERNDYYYSKRAKFNELIDKSVFSDEKAALFIFLNKTCFNGLYRVNAKGCFNVPMGSYKKPPICDADNLRLVSRLLQNVNIMCGDYSQCEEFIDNETFVYIDPPYRPLNETSSFTSYAKAEFGDEQQIQLAHFIEKISAKGAMVVASNSDPKNTDETDNFFDEVYKNFFIQRVSATRRIKSKSSGGGTINELLICNF